VTFDVLTLKDAFGLGRHMSTRFSSILTRPNAVGAWTFAPIPAAVARRAGFRARMRVTGTINGVPFRSSLIPRGRGEVFVVVNAEMRAQIGKQEGDTVRLELEPDTKPFPVRVPPVLRDALQTSPNARSFFEGLTASQRLAYIRWIDEAKQPTTRERRVKLALQKLVRREKFN
jgi:hypothetical protein